MFESDVQTTGGGYCCRFLISLSEFLFQNNKLCRQVVFYCQPARFWFSLILTQSVFFALTSDSTIHTWTQKTPQRWPTTLHHFHMLTVVGKHLSSVCRYRSVSLASLLEHRTSQHTSAVSAGFTVNWSFLSEYLCLSRRSESKCRKQQ